MLSISDCACFRIAGSASGACVGRGDPVAVRIAGDWRFVVPRESLLLFDRDASRMIVFRSQWHSAKVIRLPDGDTVLNREARSALAALVKALQVIGVLAAPVP